MFAADTFPATYILIGSIFVQTSRHSMVLLLGKNKPKDGSLQRHLSARDIAFYRDIYSFKHNLSSILFEILERLSPLLRVGPPG